MIDTSIWDKRLSDINNKLTEVENSKDSNKIKATTLLEINSSLDIALTGFDTSVDFTNIKMWENWIGEYTRLSSVINNIAKDMSYITSEIIGADIDEDSALNLISKFMQQNGYINDGNSFVKGDSRISIAENITDEYIDYLVNQVRG